jgi:hypothetical protein
MLIGTDNMHLGKLTHRQSTAIARYTPRHQSPAHRRSIGQGRAISVCLVNQHAQSAADFAV